MFLMGLYHCDHLRTGLSPVLPDVLVGSTYSIDANEYLNNRRATFLLSRLPPALVVNIKEAKNYSYEALADTINLGFSGSPNSTVTVTLNWFERNSRSREIVCWNPRTIQANIDSHSNLVGAIANTLTRSRTTLYGDLGKRFAELPPGWLSAGVAHCLYIWDPEYVAIRGKAALAWSLDSYRGKIRNHNHVFLRAVLHASFENYRRTIHSAVVARRGKPYTPRSFTEFAKNLRNILNENSSVCITFGEAKVDEYSYWIMI
ncbi:hypothetical protein GQ602_001130 [Ophiocordyceps camponoti-floridani]|uniref:Uncharacterized protein n=1 Tax=Ophiocordyceps camponoti-floridani TaxID=2030778 RepID=A0A8H4QDK7_9HYPO|nr:hypothetical protein GQ602_001130 [Ophiocordyceps camponoti-floridani]